MSNERIHPHDIENLIAAKATEDGLFAIAYALLRLKLRVGEIPITIRMPPPPKPEKVKTAGSPMTLSPNHILLNDANLSARTRNCLYGGGITTLEQLTHCTRNWLLRALPGFGTRSADEVELYLARLGLHLGTEPIYEGREAGT